MSDDERMDMAGDDLGQEYDPDEIKWAPTPSPSPRLLLLNFLVLLCTEEGPATMTSTSKLEKRRLTRRPT